MNKSIKKNYIYNTLFQLLNIILPIITAPYISRIFGADNIGIQSYTASIVSIFILIATFGTSTYGQREIAMQRDDRKKCSNTFWEIEFLNIIITSICIIFYLVFIFIFPKYRIIYIVMSMQIISVAFDITWLYAGNENFGLITLRNTLIKLLGIVLLFVFIKSDKDLLLYIIILSSTGLVGNIIMWFGINKLVDKPVLKNINVKKHFKETFIYFIPALATSVYTILDKTMIGIITKDVAQNGYYEQANKIINIAKTIVLSLNTVMYARMSYIYAKKDFSKLKKYLETSLDYTCLIAIAMVMGIIGITDIFVPLFFGEGYEKVQTILILQTPLIFIVGISNLLGRQYLTPSGQRKKSSRVIIVGAIINFILNLFLIKLYGTIGAVFSSICAELTITILYIYMSKSVINIRDVIKYSYKRIFAGIIMLIVIKLIALSNLSSIFKLCLQVSIGSVTYFIVLLLVRDSLIYKYIFSKNKKVKRNV